MASPAKLAFTAVAPAGKAASSVAVPFASVVAGRVCDEKLKEMMRPFSGLPEPSVNNAPNRSKFPNVVEFCPI